eukprot:g939.t1
MGLVESFRIKTRHGLVMVAYKCSPKGQQTAETFDKHIRSVVDALVMDPIEKDELLEVFWDETMSKFKLISRKSVYSRTSAVTEAEDVSYVSTAYIPACLRLPFAKKPFDFSPEAKKSAEGVVGIKDELDELIHLSHVNVVMSEWLPYGSNAMIALNKRLGSSQKIQRHNFSSASDDDRNGTQCGIVVGGTEVSVLDFSLIKHVNIEAFIKFPEESGVVQLENFGINIRERGNITYGLRVDAIADRVASHLSIDHLVRLLVDIHLDSSTLIDSLLTPYQQSILDIIFRANADARDKTVAVFAESIEPRLDAEKFLDREDHESEIRQLIGTTQGAFDITKDEMIIIGEKGVLVVGNGCKRHEDLLVSYLALRAIDVFIEAFYKCLFFVHDRLHTVHNLIANFERDPAHCGVDVTSKVVIGIQDLSRDVARISETLWMLKHAVTLNAPRVPNDEKGRTLYELLGVADHLEQLKYRVSDLEHSVEGAKFELEGLRALSHSVKESNITTLNDLSRNTNAVMEEIYQSSRASSDRLNQIMFFIGGILAFDLLDRIIGSSWTTLVANESWVISFLGIINNGRPRQANEYTLNLHVEANTRISTENMKLYLRGKSLETDTTRVDARTSIREVSWHASPLASRSRWFGHIPFIRIAYDEIGNTLKTIEIIIPNALKDRGREKENEVMSGLRARQIFMDDLANNEVLMNSAEFDDDVSDSENNLDTSISQTTSNPLQEDEEEVL